MELGNRAVEEAAGRIINAEINGRIGRRGVKIGNRILQDIIDKERISIIGVEPREEIELVGGKSRLRVSSKSTGIRKAKRAEAQFAVSLEVEHNAVIGVNNVEEVHSRNGGK